MGNNYNDWGDGSILSDIDIQNEMAKGNLFIAPYEPLQLQPSGYNLTPTRLIYSTKRKKLLTVYENNDEVYVMVERNDTVLVRTRETLIVPAKLAGAFYSKVKVVSQGFGHVSTTLDPHWEGQLLISLNNPTDRKLKFSIEKNVYGKTIYNSFVTVQFMTLRSSTPKHSDNLSGRLDIFEATLERNVSVLKKHEIQRLRDLVAELHKYERKTLDAILIEKLDENERQQWNQIQVEANEDSYREKRKVFLEEKHKRYLRCVREQVNEDAQSCIDIVNRYIEKKQQCLPLSYRIFHWLLGHAYELAGLLIVALIVVFIAIMPKSSPKENISFWQRLLSDDAVVVELFLAAVGYIIAPIFSRIARRMWNRIR
ncbi:dCTP deaminase domain-containing protein [Lacrimispora indolis]|uniref:dCTP deaminase domain-containing protein n=1 Tax=Lacrimispora indolis TaxID=69825 RepID=UPI003561C350